METTQINFDDWHEHITVKKGDIGEQLVIDYLSKKNFVVYKPITQGAHPFDNLCASRDKKKIFIAEVKTKEARKYYPDTGINIRNYSEYKFIQNKYNLKVYLFFVDATNMKIYGNIIDMLETEYTIKGKTYPLIQNGIIYFPLIKMKEITELTKDQVNIIRGYTTKHYDDAWKF